MAAAIETFAPPLRQSQLPAAGFLVTVPAQAAGASLVYFDLFTTTTPLLVWLLKALKYGDVAVVGTLGVHLVATRTTAVGTGGTAAVNNSANLAQMSITSTHPTGLAVPSGVTGRLSPAGGATAGAILGFGQVFPEETTGDNYEGGIPLVDAPFLIEANSGIRVVQGAVASVGNTGFKLYATPFSWVGN